MPSKDTSSAGSDSGGDSSGGYSINSSGTNSQVRFTVYANQILVDCASADKRGPKGQPLLQPRLRLFRQQQQLLSLLKHRWQLLLFESERYVLSA